MVVKIVLPIAGFKFKKPYLGWILEPYLYSRFHNSSWLEIGTRVLKQGLCKVSCNSSRLHAMLGCSNISRGYLIPTIEMFILFSERTSGCVHTLTPNKPYPRQSQGCEEGLQSSKWVSENAVKMYSGAANQRAQTWLKAFASLGLSSTEAKMEEGARDLHEPLLRASYCPLNGIYHSSKDTYIPFKGPPYFPFNDQKIQGASCGCTTG